ncbi:MAG: hypothetical protein QFX32_02255 [Methanolinea sp.]|nr:hypothetical protein [Methanolinea sp.]
MNASARVFVVFFVACLSLAPFFAGAESPAGEEQAWYAVHCNVDGAKVYFDGDYKGEIRGGVLVVPVHTAGTPSRMYSVQAEGYTAFTAIVPGVPGKGETYDLQVTLVPAPQTRPPLVGGDMGWITVHCNVDGAAVSFDGTHVGYIANGILTVPVYTTATPYRTYTVTMKGYLPFTGTIDRYPAKGETIDLQATLEPAPPTSPARSPLAVLPVLLSSAAAALLAARGKG